MVIFKEKEFNGNIKRYDIEYNIKRCNMEAIVDSIGNPLDIGSFVLYYPTGTKGHVTEIMKDKEGVWILLDKTDLYYRTDIITVIGKTKDKEIGEKIFTREDMSTVLEKEKEAAKVSEMGDVSLESGG